MSNRGPIYRMRELQPDYRTDGPVVIGAADTGGRSLTGTSGDAFRLAYAAGPERPKDRLRRRARYQERNGTKQTTQPLTFRRIDASLLVTLGLGVEVLRRPAVGPRFGWGIWSQLVHRRTGLGPSFIQAVKSAFGREDRY